MPLCVLCYRYSPSISLSAIQPGRAGRSDAHHTFPDIWGPSKHDSSSWSLCTLSQFYQVRAEVFVHSSACPFLWPVDQSLHLALSCALTGLTRSTLLRTLSICTAFVWWLTRLACVASTMLKNIGTPLNIAKLFRMCMLSCVVPVLSCAEWC